MLPILAGAGAAKEVLGIPCSSAKSESVYSVGEKWHQDQDQEEAQQGGAPGGQLWN